MQPLDAALFLYTFSPSGPNPFMYVFDLQTFLTPVSLLCVCVVFQGGGHPL